MSAGTEGGTSPLTKGAVGLGCGCLLMMPALAGAAVVILVFGGLGVLLAPLIALILLFTGGGGQDTSAYEEDAQEMIKVIQGDGKGELDASRVPEDMAESIEEAGKLCDAIGPVVIAAQIDEASGFDGSVVGDKGEKGVSQLPPDIFERYGQDDDDNDKVSALDVKDSIMAQGRFMCDLAGQAQAMIDANEATGSTLDLALAGYRVGMDAVRAAKEVPATNEAQGYIASIRSRFPEFQGVGAPPPETTPGVTPEPTPGSTTEPAPESSGPSPTGSGPTTSSA